MAPSIKALRIAKIIQKYITKFLVREYPDLFAQCNVTEVQLTNDLGIATIYYTLATNADQEIMQNRLNSIKNVVRSYLAQHLATRRCPELIFKYDDLIEKANHIEDLINRNHQ